MSFDLRHVSVDEILNREEIRSAAAQANIDHDGIADLLDEIYRENQQEILRAAAKEIAAYEELEEKAKAANAKAYSEYTELTNMRDHPPGASTLALRRFCLYALIAILPLLLVAYVGTVLVMGWNYALILIKWIGVPTILLACLIYLLCVATLFFFYLRKNQEIAQYRDEFAARRDALDLEPYASELARADTLAQDTALEDGVLPELRIRINAYLTSRYDGILEVTDAPGLAEVPNPDDEIATDAQAELDRLLNSIPGGSIGIAGPRGAGKSTLLRSFCEPSPYSRPNGTTLKGRSILSVMASAPVQYEAREFILHIFASVCQRVLKHEGEEAPQPLESMARMQQSDDTNPIPLLLPRLVGVREVLASFLVGLLLLVFSIYVANSTAQNEQAPTADCGDIGPQAPCM